MKHLNELKHKWGAKGLVIISGSSQSTGTIEPWAKEQGAEFPIFVDDGGATARAYNVSSIPACALVGPDGKVVYRGHPSSVNDRMLEPVMAKVVLRFAFDFPKAYGKIKSKIDKKDFAGALKDVDGMTEPADAEFHAKLRADLVGYAQDVKKNALADAEAGDYLAAEAALKELAKQFKGTEPGKEIDALLAEWKKDATVKKELKAGKLMLKARAMEKAFNFGAAAGIYNSVTKKYKGTKTAEVAAAKLETIMDNGMHKINAKCKKCTTFRKPCAKHQ